MRTYLETERIILRDLTESDVDLLVELDSDPAVMRFINGGRPTPREEIRTRTLPALLDEYERYPGTGRWAALEKSTGEFIGWFALRVNEDAGPDQVELGYRLRRPTWGQGYATEGSRALIARAFGDLGVHRVMATTMTVNLASRRVMEKAGLSYVRTFHLPWPDLIEGTTEGDVEYALLAHEWRPLA
jgi:RimJ/RimL family protein N-acetyltransferase